jgi:hypothetical protein
MSHLEPRISDEPLPVDDLDIIAIDEDALDLPVSSDKHFLKGVLKNILPYLGSDEGKIILTQVMVALKLEGIIGKELNHRETKMVNVIKDSIMQEPRKKRQALNLAHKLLESNHDKHL